MSILYQPQFRVTGSTAWVLFGNPIPGTSVAITGLNASTRYDFEIIAINSFGSTASAVVTASTTSPSGIPPPGSVGGTQTSGTIDPVVSGPAQGTVLVNGTLAITGITVSDVAAAAATTWNPADASAGYAFSNGNLTALSGAADVTGGEGLRGTIGRTAQKLFFEVKISGTMDGAFALGLANAAFVLNAGGGLGSDANSFGFYPVYNPASGSLAQSGYLNNIALTSGSTTSSDVSGAILSFAFDLTAPGFVWVTGPAMRAAIGPNAWNNSTTANPATGVGGMPLAAMLAGPYFITTTARQSGTTTLLNAGASAFSIPVPTSFTAWDGPMTVVFTTTAGTLSSVSG